MKKILLLLLIIVTLQANAQEFSRVANKHWKGKSEAKAGFTKNGMVYLTQDLTFSGSASSVTGSCKTTMNLDGKIYTSNLNFKGSFSYSSSGSKLIIASSRIESSDALPTGLQWFSTTGTLSFYSNYSKYRLKGTLYASDNNANQVDLSEE